MNLHLTAEQTHDLAVYLRADARNPLDCLDDALGPILAPIARHVLTVAVIENAHLLPVAAAAHAQAEAEAMAEYEAMALAAA